MSCDGNSNIFKSAAVFLLCASSRLTACNGAEPGCFDLVLESTGGADLGVALGRLAPGGLVVTYGNSSRAPTTFNVSDFYGRGSVALQGLFLFDELVRRGNSGARDLAVLAGLVAEGELVPQISITAPWRAPWPAMQALVERSLVGKAVLDFAAPVA